MGIFLQGRIQRINNYLFRSILGVFFFDDFIDYLEDKRKKVRAKKEGRMLEGLLAERR